MNGARKSTAEILPRLCCVVPSRHGDGDYSRNTGCGDFAEMTAFERYGVKTSEKANMHWLTSTMFSPFSMRTHILQLSALRRGLALLYISLLVHFVCFLFSARRATVYRTVR